MKTVDECKKFLIDFFKSTPGLITGIYNPENGKEVLNDALVENNWRHEAQYSPENSESYINQYDQDNYEVWQKGYNYYRGPSYYQGNPLLPSRIAHEHTFWLFPEKYDSGVMFLVLEDKQGQLYLGNYIGD